MKILNKILVKNFRAILMSLLLMLLWTMPFMAEAQIFKRKKKDGQLTELVPTDTSQAFKANKLVFANLHKIRFYHHVPKIEQLNKFQRDKDWDNLYLALYDYVCHFGIENFYDARSLDILWQLARVSEYLGKIEMTKETFRILLKHYRGDLRKALIHYDSLTKFDRPLYAELDKYYEMLELRKYIDTLHPPRSVLETMGNVINSPKHEDYGVTISKDDTELLFTSKRTKNENYRRGVNSEYNEDIYFSIRKDESEKSDEDDEEWKPIAELKKINTEYNEGSPCISKDGKYLVFARCYSPDGFGNCDLYITERQVDGSWNEPQNLGESINGTSWESHPSFSITGDTLFFASNRQGGFGGTDIYFSEKDPKGRWQTAKNMGAVVNTRKNEVSPFMHPIHHVLYFSSDGQLVNFGDFDIYKTYQEGSEWTEPYNIGPLVNGAGSEFYFAIDSKSRKLYYARSEEHIPESLDLFSFPLPMEAQPTATVKFSGRITEETTGEVFEGMVSIIDLDEGIEIAPRKLYEDGTFEFELINKRRYMLIVQGENFFRLEEVFFLEGDMEANFHTRSIKNIRFESIEFDKGSAELKPEMENDLHLVIDFLIEHPDFNLTILGHTDLSGDASVNLKLSQARADAIRDYIISYGSLPKERVSAKGMGSTQPIISEEKTEEDKQVNRRVEFKLKRKGEDDTEDDS